MLFQFLHLPEAVHPFFSHATSSCGIAELMKHYHYCHREPTEEFVDLHVPMTMHRDRWNDRYIASHLVA